MLIARAEDRANERRIAEAKKNEEADKKVTTASSTTTSTEKKASSETTNTRVIHRVRRGDTLIDIARKYKVTVPQIREWKQYQE